MKIKLTQFSLECGASVHEVDYPFRDGDNVALSFQLENPIKQFELYGITEFIHADIRFKVWEAAIKSNSVNEIDYATSATEGTPLRFDNKFVFIEPYISVNESNGIKWRANPKWIQAKYQAIVYPAHGCDVKYLVHPQDLSTGVLQISRRSELAINGANFRCEYFERK